MNLLAPPLEIMGRTARTVFGRAVCFLLTCSIGRGVGFVLEYLWYHLVHYLGEMKPRSDNWFFSGLWDAMLVVPTHPGLPAIWELAIYAVCILMAFVFIRFELAFQWLLIPFCLMLSGSVASRLALI